ncbi:MAG: transporter [Candidatus Xenobia bacterium]
MLPGILIMVVFLVLAGLMMARKMPALLALPLLAVAIGIIVGVAAGLPRDRFQDFLFNTILEAGSARLALAMMYAVFGAMLSQVVMRQGIAQRIVRVAAEYAGDHKLILALGMTLAVALCFTSLAGLGAVIMIGSLALPILIGAGLSPRFSACCMLFAISVGGTLNFSNLGLYKNVLGLSDQAMVPFAEVYAVLLGIATLVFMAWEWRGEGKRMAFAVNVTERQSNVPMLALVTPLLPIVLILVLKWAIIPSFIVGALYGLLTTEPRRIIPNLTAALLEGLKDMSPAIGLFIGLGMLLNATADPVTSKLMAPFITAIVPKTKLGYVAFFALLAPLGLYRGPFNFYGLGTGIAALMQTMGLPPLAVMAAFLSVGQIQGVCDPTNTSNVWLAQFTHTSTEDFMKRTIPFVWGFVLVALLYAVAVGKVMP